ncbi:hypothetical protein L6164_016246 [Bauhinia variegata]|uniref:Uncharacterized protein n=1 Tax=Bauhinia variegata TaxID=167791 RepID=A0ACB9NQD9_BAUVA|nr:hypothetical protein L6164_016246 [Bauhinia variegata]
MGFKWNAAEAQVAVSRLLLLLLACLLTTREIEGKNKYSSCDKTCGKVHFQYPFGTTPNCSRNESFRLTCNKTSGYAFANISTTKNIQIQSISLRGELRITAPAVKLCFNAHGETLLNSTLYSPFAVSSTKNKFTVVGCDTSVKVGESLSSGQRFTTGCELVCTNFSDVRNGSCSGIGCCQTTFPKDVKGFNLTMSSFHNYSKEVINFNRCSYAFVVEDGKYDFSSQDLIDLRNRTEFPMILSWAVERKTCAEAKKYMDSYACKSKNSECETSENGVGYICKCKDGYDGNPYLDDDEDESCRKVGGRNPALPIASVAALVGLAALSHSFSWMPKQKTLDQLFVQNGGEEFSSLTGGESQTPTVYSQDEIEMFTQCFDATKVIRRGLLGTVYRGTLPNNNREVAVKKTRQRGGPRKAAFFIREAVALCNINNENVAQLLGICLQTEVPILIYEFVKSTRTLYGVINAANNENANANEKENQGSLILSWEERLKIAADTAEAISCMHSASVPIVHGNIKSCNILLDEDGKAKLTDCGALRLIPLEDLVKASPGYVDPEYIHTGELNEKSDVYSFGVVLIELLTGVKAVEFGRVQQEKTLVLHFVSAMNRNHLMGVIDRRIMNGTNEKELWKVATLASSCVKLIGEERPSMKDVAEELKPLAPKDGIKNSNPPDGEDENENEEGLIALIAEASTSVCDVAQGEE